MSWKWDRTIDQAALRETLDAVIAADAVGRWRQDVWFETRDVSGRYCGTAGCLAGWCAFVNGYTEIGKDALHLFNPTTGHCIPRSGIREWATDRLGLDDNQATELFAAHNTLSDLKEIVDELCEAPRG
jgi:hypothetical protein